VKRDWVERQVMKVSYRFFWMILLVSIFIVGLVNDNEAFGIGIISTEEGGTPHIVNIVAVHDETKKVDNLFSKGEVMKLTGIMKVNLISRHCEGESAAWNECETIHGVTIGTIWSTGLKRFSTNKDCRIAFDYYGVGSANINDTPFNLYRHSFIG